MATEAPRSTCSHCGSLNALDHRVAALPSTAAAAGKAGCSTDEAVTGLPWDSGASSALARCGGPVTYQTSAAMTATATPDGTRSRDRGWRRRDGEPGLIESPMPRRFRILVVLMCVDVWPLRGGIFGLR